MDKYINDELVKNTYLFCAKRISDSEAAKDLSQDILYEALRTIRKGKSFVSFYSWYWKMARNKYANYVSHRQNSDYPLETASGSVSEFLLPIDNLIKEENMSELNYSLSRLATINREIIVRYYLKEQKINQIANELQMPVGTVKRRLFDAKKNLKERFENMNDIGKSSYAPTEVNYEWGYGCGDAVNVMKQKIAEQVPVLCRIEAKTTNEISDEIGVAPVYLEPILNQMVNVKLLVSPSKNKYLSNFSVFPNEIYNKAEYESYITFWENGFPQMISKALQDLKKEIYSLDFYGNDFNYSYLLWIFYVLACYNIGDIARNKYIEVYKGKYKDEAERTYRLTMRYSLPDEKANSNAISKSMSWSSMHQSFKTVDYGNIEYVNNYEAPPFPAEGESFMIGRDYWINGNNISLLISLSGNPTKGLNKHEEEMVADFIKKGLVKKTTKGLKVMLPIFSRETINTIYTTIGNAMNEIAVKYSNLVSYKIEEILLPYVRKDLMSNFIYWDMKTFLQPICYLFYYGLKEAKELEEPENYNSYAAGLYFITG